jgi:two-component system, NarL family, sensor histidine kinase UhpB
MDVDTTWHYASPGVSTLLGHCPEQVLGMKGSELVHPDDLNSFQACLREVGRKAQQERQLSFRLRHSDGAWRSVDATFANHLNDSSVSAIICNFRASVAPNATTIGAEATLQNFADLLEAARIDERKRIAREIHDELGSCLTVIKLYLGSINGKGRGQRSGFGVSLEALTELVTSALKTVSNICTALRPFVMEHRDLWRAIEWLVGDVKRAASLKCTLDFDKTAIGLELSGEQSTLLFRVVQEALTNVMKHANARQVQISAKAVGQEILVVIQDDGEGITANARQKSEAWGIVGMRERAHALGGKLKIEACKSGGTKLSVSLPVASAMKNLSSDRVPIA